MRTTEQPSQWRYRLFVGVVLIGCVCAIWIMTVWRTPATVSTSKGSAIPIAVITSTITPMRAVIIQTPTPNIEIQTVVATPTAIIIDRAGVVTQVRQLAQLVTMQLAVDRVVEAQRNTAGLASLLTHDQLLMIVSGTITAGVDLGKVTFKDVRVSADGRTLTVTLPPSEIFTLALDNQRTHVYSRSQGLLGGDPQLETDARRAGEQQILQAACEAHILDHAADAATIALTRMFGLLHVNVVDVQTSAGPCVAPRSAMPRLTDKGPTPTPIGS